MSNNYLITSVNVTGTTNYTDTVFVYASALNSPQGAFEWGSACANGTVTPVANYPIVPLGGTYPNISYLQLSNFQAEYQLFWEPNADPSQVNLVAQILTGSYYPDNKITLLTIPADSTPQLQLSVNLSADPKSALSLTVLAQSQNG